ncbi:hypothetical protein SNE40_015707 [Patella caerulea]|uniref:Uncharacterized protein n=1 Tax=Patella caerulea TaxID=87958 RepID=A0AAN8JKH0_PATCE
MQVLPLVLVLCFTALVSSASISDVGSLEPGTKLVKRSTNQCFKNGKTYNLGEIVEDDKCRKDCICSTFWYDPYIDCKQVIC